MFKVIPRAVARFVTKGSNNGPFREQPLRFRIYVNLLEYGRRLRHVIKMYDVELLGALIVFLVLLLAACVTDVIEPDEVITEEDLADIAEGYCAANPELTCGHVYLCETPAENEFGTVEICLLDDIPLPVLEEVHGLCTPTPRHQGLCWWCCGEGCGAGCNAYSGCFCPATPMPDPMPVPEDPNPVPPVKDQ